MDKKKLALVIENTKGLLKEHPLCDHCLGRMFAEKLGVVSHKRLGNKIRNMLKQRPPKTCYICKNMMLNLDLHLKKMIDITKEYQFYTFLIGAILQPSIHDRDDLIRSKFKLRGIPSIKSDVTREMGKSFSRKTRSKVDYQNPDMVFTIDFKKEYYDIKPKAVLLQARYTKNIRGLPQKQKPCDQCEGKGCFVCDFHGIREFNSVEGKIAKFLIDKFGAQQAKITWIGSEDESSLVMGNGRPFFVKLVNPRKRNVSLQKKLDLDGVLIHKMHVISKIPSDPVRFRTEVVMEVDAENEITHDALGELEKLEGRSVVLYENSGRKHKKVIYDIKLNRESETSFKIMMKSDGGIPLKRFVAGQDVEPSISSILETNCKCKLFDFNKIIIMK
ncbi:MAG: tRNA pseudouridine(54/55) synthase Pus10 [Thaumarchaeota archaeon]|nr:tRNA pseudouridine(54/55) synthase Pus10 [Nitrososphaerota archaeon]MDE1871891.1 tRNA pseudouridine(54/55) synthase Pus10 [Nitrososphaerota archaeon]